MAVGKWYDFHEFGWYMGNVGLKEELWGHARVTLRAIPGCPLDYFTPVEVLGGGFITGDFHATDENGWGRTVATLDG